MFPVSGFDNTYYVASPGIAFAELRCHVCKFVYQRLTFGRVWGEIDCFGKRNLEEVIAFDFSSNSCWGAYQKELGGVFDFDNGSA